jgi:hypothetical protein
MAISFNNDGFSGKLGNSVSYLLNGKLVKRGIGIRTDLPSEKIKPYQQITGMVNVFLKPVRGFVKIGFQAEGKKAMKTAYTMATSYTRVNAIKGLYPEQMIDFEKVLFSKGTLPLADNAVSSVVAEGIYFSWSPKPAHARQSLHDRSLLMAYNIDTGDAFYQLNGCRRHLGGDTIILPEFKNPVRLETYLAFLSPDQTEISNSQYLGQLKYGVL